MQVHSLGGDRLRHLKAEVANHRVVGLGQLALGGEIVADEDRVGRVQPQRLQAAQVQLAAAGDAQLARRGSPGGTWRAPSGSSSGVSSDGPASGVPSMGLRKFTGIDSTPRSRSSKAIDTTSRGCSPMPMMPPEQSSMPAVRTARERVDAVLVGVRRADLAVVLAAGVEVVIHLVRRRTPPAARPARA